MAEPTFDHDRRDVCRIPKPWTCSTRYAREQWLRAAQPMTLSTAESSVFAESSVVYLDTGRGFAIYDAGKRGHRYLPGSELARQSLLVAAREELGFATYDRNMGQLFPEAGCVELDLLGVVGKHSWLSFLKNSPNEVEASGREDYSTAQEVRLSPRVGASERLSRLEMVACLREAGLAGKAGTGSRRRRRSRSAKPCLTVKSPSAKFRRSSDAAYRLQPARDQALRAGPPHLRPPAASGARGEEMSKRIGGVSDDSMSAAV